MIQDKGKTFSLLNFKTMTNYQNIETIIRNLANENFSHYPESYNFNPDGTMTDDCAENLGSLANFYYEHRTEYEIERDKNANVHLEDYLNIVTNACASHFNIEV